MFLVRLLEQPRIFLSDWFHARLDPAARVNLRRAIERLGV
jgi:predicted metal-dependent HD superfamily phosphohydrolase